MSKSTPKRLVIKVTQEDITRGVPGDCFHCPIARAVERTLGVERVSVTEEDIEIGRGAPVSRPRYRLSPALAAFVVDFDTGQPVKPFTGIATRIPIDQ